MALREVIVDEGCTPFMGARSSLLGVLAAVLALAAFSCGPTESLADVHRSQQDLAAESTSCPWNPGFGSKDCHANEWWREFSVDDATTSTMKVETGGANPRTITLGGRFAITSGLKFTGATGGKVATGTLIRLRATQAAASGGMTALSDWFPYLTSAPTMTCGACVPRCSGLCGDDGCGGTCSCASGAVCLANQTCCVPNNNACGPDGCGGSHGECTCTPSCAPGTCGSNGCGGTCSCLSGAVCLTSQTCCVSNNSTCGPDGCGGSHGECPNTTCTRGDEDNDGVCDDRDNCTNCWNPEQIDADHDGLGDCWRCDWCVGPGTDTDWDGICDGVDNCPNDWNQSQSDSDHDGIGDACDVGQSQPPTAPGISVQPGIQYVKPGQTATFTVVATGTPPLHYQWKKSGSTNVGTDSPSYTTPATTTSNNGEKYLVVVSNAAGSVSSDEATLTVNASDLPAAIQSQPQNITVTVGESATFTVVVSGTGPLHYQWRKGTTPVGTDSPGLTFTKALTTDAGSYTVTVTNAVNSVISTSATLTVNPAPVAPTITTQLKNITVTEGGAANFTVVASGTGPLHYQWRKGTVAVGADSAGLTFTKALTTDAGSYTVTVTNAVGSVTSSGATLSVNAATTVSVRVSLANATLAVGATLTFTASVTGSSNTAVNWTATGGTITTGGLYTAPATPGNYVVRATSQADGTKYAEATVRVVPAGHQIRVLFLGNSFINEHHLEAQVMGLAQAAGLSFYAEAYTIGGSDLKEHWDASDQASLKKIQEGGWDFVVLEPFWHAYGTITKEQELVYARYFDAEIKKVGGRTVIFSTWALGWAAVGKPTDANLWDYNNEETADKGNLWMAQQLGALAVGAGDAWQVSYLRYPSILLYESDGCHPTNTGHYFTAAQFLIALTGVDPTGNSYLPPASGLDVVSSANAALLRALAWELR